MNDVITQIHQDHINMARLLDLVDNEIGLLIGEKPPDLEILEYAMHYMINYADKVHHPKEDVLFARLQQIDPDAPVATVLQEHHDILSKGDEFYELVRAAESADFVLRDHIIEKGLDYVKSLRSHMDTEERDLLKRAKEGLSEQQLRDIETEVESRHDPLFGDVVEKEYQQLYDHIMRQTESYA